MFRLIATNFSQKCPHFSLLSPTSPCELPEREVTSPSNLKVVGALLQQLFSSLYVPSTSHSDSTTAEGTSHSDTMPWAWHRLAGQSVISLTLGFRKNVLSLSTC